MIIKMKKPIEFGTYIHRLRKEKKYSLKIVADKLGIDLSLLSKIENGERQLQSHMLNGLSEIFELDYKEMQIQLLNQKIENEYGDEPFIIETIEMYLRTKKQHMNKE
jgi:HTH-type transcriptional regulator, competence development regulator